MHLLLPNAICQAQCPLNVIRFCVIRFRVLFCSWHAIESVRMDLSTLIECVKNESVLYDQSNFAFKNPAVKSAAWVRVAASMNDSPENCAAAWKSVRERYSREKRYAEGREGNAATASLRKPWRHMKALSFLKEHVKSRRSRTNLNLSDTVQMQNLVSPLSPNSSQSSSSTSEQKFWYSEPEICLNEYDKEVLPESPADRSVGTRLPMDIKSRQSVPSTSSQSSDFIVDANDREVKQFLASATSSPFLESPLRPKKIKLQEETAVMFGNALENILERTQQSRQSTLEDTDSLIAKNVEYCLKTLPTNELKIKFRKKFRNLIEECEETILFHAPTGK